MNAVRRARRSELVALYVLFGGSGGIALAYQVLWVRRFSDIFGATVPAVAATLCAVFLGLMIGSLAAARVVARFARPLLVYALLEVGISAGALLVGPILDLYTRFYPSLYAAFAQSPQLFTAAKSALAAIAVLIPATLMGATLPLLAPAISAGNAGLGAAAGGLYAANTLGAALGTLGVPFILLPTLGAATGYNAAVLLNLGIAGLALLLDRSRAFTAVVVTPIASRPVPARFTSAQGKWLLLGAFFSGICALALELLWTRMFSLVHENSIYSFAIVLACFLLGLAVGAAVAQKALRFGIRPRSLLCISWLAAGACVVLSPKLFFRATSGMEYLGIDRRSGSGLGILLPALVILIPATIAAGMALPAILHAAARDTSEGAGRGLARVLGANMCGSIVGPLLATFILGPALGLWWSVAMLGAGLWLAGVLVLPRARSGRGDLFRFLGLAALFSLALVSPLGPSGLPAVRIATDEDRILCLREGLGGTMAVLENSHDRWITFNNFYILGGTAAITEERQQGHIPLLLHPAPREVAFLGVGTGITVASATLHPVERIVALEIAPEILHATSDHFADANRDLARDPRVELLAEDARNYMRGTDRCFDVVVGDLFVPWRSGEASLYTREHFEAVRRRLRPGGLFCQWLPLFQLSESEFAIIAATFLDVFPATTLWRGDFLADRPAVALIGHTAAEPLDAALADSRVQALAPALDWSGRFLADPAGLWLFLVGPLELADLGVGVTRRNSEEEPWIEVLSPHWGGAASPSDRYQNFLGPALDTFFGVIGRKELAGSPLAALTGAQLAWRGIGAELWQASRLLTEGRTEAARIATRNAAAKLPPGLQRALGNH